MKELPELEKLVQALRKDIQDIPDIGMRTHMRLSAINTLVQIDIAQSLRILSKNA